MLNFLKINNQASQILESSFLEFPGVFNYSPTASIQFATKAFTPINLNLEIIASSPTQRKLIVNKLIKTIPRDFDYVCGIESGGSYFASAVADILKKKLILLRKFDKIEDHPLSRIVGPIPDSGSSICLIDDVLSTGLTLFHAQKFFATINCNLITASIVFSYGYEDNISEALKIPISVASRYSLLIRLAQEKHMLTYKDIIYLNKYVRTFKNYLHIKKIV